MAEPWLDNLSEGWQSQPGSSSPAVSLPGSQNAASLRDRKGSARSRNDLPSHISLHEKIHKRALRERSNSDINIPHFSQPPLALKSPRGGGTTPESTLSFSGSILQYESVHRRSKSSSPPKGKSKTATPDWKKLVMGDNKNTCGRQDLFSPIRLEGIFRQPRVVPPPDTGDIGKARFSLFGGMIDLPSSPPPWAARTSDLGSQEKQFGLEAVEEQDEDTSEHTVAMDANRKAAFKPTFQLNDDSRISPSSSVASGAPSMEPNRDIQADGALMLSSEYSLHSGGDAASVVHHSPLPDAQRVLNPSPSIDFIPRPLHDLPQAQSHTASSLAGTFSPVFVSKHKTAEGIIDYNALDLSDPQVLGRLRDSYTRQLQHEAIQDAEQHNNIPNSMSTNVPTEYDIPSSPFSSSVLPSDSVSQVNTLSRGTRTGYPCTSLQESLNNKPHTPPPNDVGQPLLDTPARSPGSPLKLFGNHDTFTNGRLLSRMTQLHELRASQQEGVQEDKSAGNGDVQQSSFASVETAVPIPGNTELLPRLSSPRDVHSKANERGVVKDALPFIFGAGTTASAAAESESDAEQPDTAQIKRAGPDLFRQSRAKRQRTLDRHEAALIAEHLSELATDEQHDAMEGDQDQQLNHPAPIADFRSSLLRARSPTPPQAEELHDEPRILGRSNLGTLQSHIQQATIPGKPADATRIKQIASEVASFRIRGPHKANGSVRKQSVSTQDYVDEATRIMDLIRSKRPLADQSYIAEEALSDSIAQPQIGMDHSSVHTVSRPPSREGRPSAWRNHNQNHKPDDPHVQDYLQKYQETGDESFMASSALHSPDGSFAEDALSEEGEGSLQIRIIDHPRIGSLTSIDDDFDNSRSQSVDSPVKTHSSNTSTDSTGRTMLSKSSGRTRTVPVIAPGKVSHLISSIESAGGMRYDPEKQAWTKKKSSEAQRKALAGASSSVETEEDPFSNISDLSVNDDGGASSRHNQLANTQQHGCLSNAVEGAVGYCNPASSTRPDQEHTAQSVAGLTTNQQPASVLDPNLQSESSYAALSNRNSTIECPINPRQRRQELRNMPESPVEIDEEFSDTESVLRTPQKPWSLPSGSISYSRREISVLFSSPLVSHDWPAQQWATESNEGSEVSSRKPESQDNFPEKFETDESAPIEAHYREITPRRSSHNSSQRQTSRSLTLSRIDEHHELSFMSTTSKGRCLSLTLAVSTPLPAHLNATVAIIHNNDARFSDALHSLSPLSDFTIHQDDGRHLVTRQLRTDQQLVLPERNVKNSTVVDQLVKVLTDVEADEPYWDSMRTLDMKDRQLQEVHSLCSFCPSLEDLDVSNNQLEQLGGIPTPVRYLDVALNRLSCLTSWHHLANLQYLDVSNNNLVTLDGLSSLLHLRELRVNNNKLTSIEGIFDLDALLSLSVSGNALPNIDFRSADLRRLTKLDISKNDIVAINGLESLPALESLDLTYNSLEDFPTRGSLERPCSNLRNLRVGHNNLTTLNVLRMSGLQTLEADNNHLSSIGGADELMHLQTISLRNQTPRALGTLNFQPDLFDRHYQNLHHLHLSGSSYTHFPLTTLFLNLRALDLSFTGLQTVPMDFSALAPNIRVLNLNTNILKSLKPLRSILKLKRLFVAENRLSRMRRTVKELANFTELEELDLRGNPLSLGFYPQTHSHPTSDQPAWRLTSTNAESSLTPFDDNSRSAETLPLRHMLPPILPAQDALQASRLDEETAQRRRVYELLLAAKCTKLRIVDGLPWNPETVMRKDKVWEQLVECGVVEKVVDDATVVGGEDKVLENNDRAQEMVGQRQSEV